jgi:hypothetical protein
MYRIVVIRILVSVLIVVHRLAAMEQARPPLSADQPQRKH